MSNWTSPENQRKVQEDIRKTIEKVMKHPVRLPTLLLGADVNGVLRVYIGNHDRANAELLSWRDWCDLVEQSGYQLGEYVRISIEPPPRNEK